MRQVLQLAVLLVSPKGLTFDSILLLQQEASRTVVHNDHRRQGTTQQRKVLYELSSEGNAMLAVQPRTDEIARIQTIQHGIGVLCNEGGNALRPDENWR